MAWIFPRDQFDQLLQAASDFLELLVDFTQFIFTIGCVVAICVVMAWLTMEKK